MGLCFKIYAFFNNSLEWKRQVCQTKQYHYSPHLPIPSICTQKCAIQAKILHYQHCDPTLTEICINKKKMRSPLCLRHFDLARKKGISKMNNLNYIFV